MRKIILLSAVISLAACGRQTENKTLERAAEQSDPAAARVLNDAARNGTDPQQALQQAGQAAAQAGPPSGALQARPNAPAHRNPGQDGKPPEKTVQAPR